jgi:hypothetical protein
VEGVKSKGLKLFLLCDSLWLVGIFAKGWILGYPPDKLALVAATKRGTCQVLRAKIL